MMFSKFISKTKIKVFETYFLYVKAMQKYHFKNLINVYTVESNIFLFYKKYFIIKKSEKRIFSKLISLQINKKL